VKQRKTNPKPGKPEPVEFFTRRRGERGESQKQKIYGVTLKHLREFLFFSAFSASPREAGIEDLFTHKPVHPFLKIFFPIWITFPPYP
jgi:hypothetical protein